jgi:hypothetical protein
MIAGAHIGFVPIAVGRMKLVFDGWQVVGVGQNVGY